MRADTLTSVNVRCTTSLTSMIEEVAAETWKRFYPKDRFDCIEWFDARPERYSLTNQFHIRRVRFANTKQGGGGPVWLPPGDIPADFVDEVRRSSRPKPARKPRRSEGDNG